jgi:peptidyl-prolyl cis-trans isomerase D
MIQGLVAYFKESIVIKIFLGLLMVSFGVWGVGDVLTPGMDPNLAIKVGRTEVSLADLKRRFEVDQERFKEQAGGKLDSTPELKSSILKRTVDQITHTATADAYGLDIGLTVPDARLREEIRNQAAFKDASGNFNNLQYQQILRSNSITEKSYLGMVASDIRRQAMLQPVIINTGVPVAMLEAITNYRAETRIADTLLISAAAVPAPAPADEATLKKVYDDNIATFTSPEYRKISALVVHAADMVDPASFDEAQVKAYYEENIDRYRDPEKRTISQLVFETKEKAEAAKALAAPGDHLADIARKANIGAPVDLGELKKNDALAKMVGDAFTLPQGQISNVVQTDLGWHLFEVKSIVAEQSVPLAMVEKSIRTTMAEDKGAEALYEATTTIEDGVAGGTPLAELAAKVGGKIVQFDEVDAQGHDKSGSPVKGLFDSQRMVAAAFKLPVGGTSNLMDIPNGNYLITVDSITPPTPTPFAEVRQRVANIWEKQTRAKAAEEMAAKVAADAGASSLSDIAAKNSAANYAQLGPITRFGDGLNPSHMIDKNRVSPELVTKLFAAKTGDVMSAPVAGGAVVARLREVIHPDNSGDAAQIRAELTESMKQGMADDLVKQMTEAFAARFPAQVNTKSVGSLVTTSSAQ